MRPQMKQSHSQQVICQLLLDAGAGEHLSPARVRGSLATCGHPVALSTVYSQLNVLSWAGFIGKTYGLHSERLYERNTDPHSHLLCRRCGQVQDLALTPDATLTTCFRALEERAQALGWQVLPLQLTLTGTCSSCPALPERAGTTTRTAADVLDPRVPGSELGAKQGFCPTKVS